MQLKRMKEFERFLHKCEMESYFTSFHLLRHACESHYSTTGLLAERESARNRAFMQPCRHRCTLAIAGTLQDQPCHGEQAPAAAALRTQTHARAHVQGLGWPCTKQLIFAFARSCRARSAQASMPFLGRFGGSLAEERACRLQLITESALTIQEKNWNMLEKVLP